MVAYRAVVECLHNDWLCCLSVSVVLYVLLQCCFLFVYDVVIVVLYGFECLSCVVLFGVVVLLCLHGYVFLFVCVFVA